MTMLPNEVENACLATMPPASELQERGITPIWLASYPRSGNTFLRIVLENVFELPTYSRYFVEGQKFADVSAEALHDAAQLPVNWRKLIGRTPDALPTLIKSHDPPDDDALAIYVVRNAGPAIHSYYHYHQSFAFEQPSLTAMIAGACQFGSWTAHYRAWQPQQRPKTLLIRYEDLVGNTSRVIGKLAAFLERDPLGGELPTFAALHAKSPKFFRHGSKSDYVDVWSTGHLALLNALHGDTMRELGYALPHAPSPGLAELAELAAIAARSHALYLQQLQKSC
jgi:hypothetical protein